MYVQTTARSVSRFCIRLTRLPNLQYSTLYNVFQWAGHPPPRIVFLHVGLSRPPSDMWFLDASQYPKLIGSVVFTARCTLVQSAVLRSHVVCLSVCLSVCPSVTLVDQDHIGRKSWKLIARTISPISSHFVSQR